MFFVKKKKLKPLVKTLVEEWESRSEKVEERVEKWEFSPEQAKATSKEKIMFW